MEIEEATKKDHLWVANYEATKFNQVCKMSDNKRYQEICCAIILHNVSFPKNWRLQLVNVSPNKLNHLVSRGLKVSFVQ